MGASGKNPDVGYGWSTPVRCVKRQDECQPASQSSTLALLHLQVHEERTLCPVMPGSSL